MNKLLFLVILIVLFLNSVAAAPAWDHVQTANGTIEGRSAQPSGVRIIKGIPFAQPPKPSYNAHRILQVSTTG